MRAALITSLTPRALRRIRAAGTFDLLAAVSADPSALAAARASGLEVRVIDFKDRPDAYVAHMRDVYDRVERACAAPAIAAALEAAAPLLGVPPRRLANAAKKGLALDLAADAKLALLGGLLFPAHERTLFVEHPDLASLAALDGTLRPAGGPARLRFKLAALSADLAARIARPVRRPKTPPGCAILFDQAYGTLENPEFAAFYRTLRDRDDVVYSVLSKDDELGRRLRGDSKPVITREWGVAGAGAKAAALRRLARLSRVKAPPALRVWLVKFLRESLRAAWLLAAARPRVFLRVRADYEPFHPVVTAVCEDAGVRHAGYMCGSYPWFNFYVGWLDFHDYGTLGRGFAALHAPSWKDAGRLRPIGPFTVETEPVPPPRPAGGRLTIGSFPTTTSDAFYLQRPFYEEFIRAVCAAARRLDARVIFKEKFDDPADIALIRREAAGLDFEILTHVHGGPRSAAVLARCDIAVVMSTSTTAWEALGLGRKLAVYDLPWVPNPLAGGDADPVARTREDLVRRIVELAALPQEEHELRTAPLVERMSARADGGLVRDFIESLTA